MIPCNKNLTIIPAKPEEPTFKALAVGCLFLHDATLYLKVGDDLARKFSGKSFLLVDIDNEGMRIIPVKHVKIEVQL